MAIADSYIADSYIKMLSKSPLKRRAWVYLRGFLSSVQTGRGLDIATREPGFSLLLRINGGQWESVSGDELHARTLEHLLGQQVHLSTENRLPFDEETFDVIVLRNFLECVEDDCAFIKECHRVLKKAGRMVIDVPHAKMGLLKAMGSPQAGDHEHPLVRPGYTSRQMFDVLKDGFNVEDSITYARFYEEACDRLFNVSCPGAEILEDRRLQRGMRTLTMAQPLLYIAVLLDALLFWSKGYRLMINAKRRLWIPRKVPVLRDGRSIADATINTKIGSAAPF